MTKVETSPPLSAYFIDRMPSDIRVAQIEFSKRTDDAQALNVAIGNVSLPMHPAMITRMRQLEEGQSPLKDGINRYAPTAGLEITREAFRHIIASSGFASEKLYVQITDGSSASMELVVLGVCGTIGSIDRPLLLIDPAYTNYNALAKRTGRKTVSVTRHLQEDGTFSLPDTEEIEREIKETKASALLVIPYDNPTGQFTNQETLNQLGRLCVKYNLWLVSDEAYRELYYGQEALSSIWGITEDKVPGITGRRIGLDSASKVFNACGLRIGALITDNQEFGEKATSEYTANLSAPTIDQWIYAALGQVSHEDLAKWFRQQRDYYQPLMNRLAADFPQVLPGIIVSKPEAAIYSVVDVRNIVKPGFDALEFVMYCARQGKVTLDGQATTLLVSPLAGFYSPKPSQENPGKTQMRIAHVETPENLAKVPSLFAALLHQYESQRP